MKHPSCCVAALWVASDVSWRFSSSSFSVSELVSVLDESLSREADVTNGRCKIGWLQAGVVSSFSYPQDEVPGVDSIEEGEIRSSVSENKCNHSSCDWTICWNNFLNVKQWSIIMFYSNFNYSLQSYLSNDLALRSNDILFTVNFLPLLYNKKMFCNTKIFVNRWKIISSLHK